MTKMFTFVLGLLLSTLLVFIPNINVAKANETIYIREDESVEGTRKIKRTGIIWLPGNVYTFTDNIFNQSIVVERDNIVIYGAGYTLQGTGSGWGIARAHSLLQIQASAIRSS